MRFVENHDEPRLAAVLGAARATAPRPSSRSTLPGVALLHEGQADGRRVRVPVTLGRRPDEPLDAELRRVVRPAAGGPRRRHAPRRLGAGRRRRLARQPLVRAARRVDVDVAGRRATSSSSTCRTSGPTASSGCRASSGRPLMIVDVLSGERFDARRRRDRPPTGCTWRCPAGASTSCAGDCAGELGCGAPARAIDRPGVGPGDRPRDRRGSPGRRASTAQFGVIVFLASDVMLFAPFFAAYFLLRATNQPWPPAGVELDVLAGRARHARPRRLVVHAGRVRPGRRAAGRRRGDAPLAARDDRPRRGVPRQPDRRVRDARTSAPTTTRTGRSTGCSPASTAPT